MGQESEATTFTRESGEVQDRAYGDDYFYEYLTSLSLDSKKGQKEVFYAYDHFSLPALDMSKVRLEDRIQSVIDKIRPIKEPVNVSLVGDGMILVRFNDVSSIFEKPYKGEGQIFKSSVEKLGPYTLIVFEGGVVTKERFSGDPNHHRLVMAFEDEVNALRFKEDFILAMTGGEIPRKPVLKVEKTNLDEDASHQSPIRNEGILERYSPTQIVGTIIFTMMVIFTALNLITLAKDKNGPFYGPELIKEHAHPVQTTDKTLKFIAPISLDSSPNE